VPSIIPSCPPRKRQLAMIAHGSGITTLASALERRHPVLRIVNCHSVPRRYAAAFAEQVEQLSRSWKLAVPSDLVTLLQREPDRPTLLFCFDDGLANTVETAAPILEAAGARAIFAVPAAWPSIPAGERADWFGRHVYPVPTELHMVDGDVAPASWEELRAAVARGHEVWSHGVDHLRLGGGLSEAVLRREIVESKQLLESKLGTPIRGYCPPVSHDVPAAALALIRSTYNFAFGGRPAPVRIGGDAHQIPRSNIEASWPASAVAMQLSPLGDALSNTLARVRA
jgi:peptidoglycan/xylan/chitin deacetylase (PgdA/CDA1 family)